jgi:3-methyladenine DNA glycosylase AlkC
MPAVKSPDSAFKNYFNPALVEDMARHLRRAWKGFDVPAFTNAALKDFKTLELKQRATQIAEALALTLPDDVSRALKIITTTLRPLDKHGECIDDATRGLAGWAIWPLGEYVAKAGLEHPDEAFVCLRELTIRSTSEFAVRPFIVRHPKKSLAVLKVWAKDSNPHVRRLASEGSRPRLPWGLRLTSFVADPAPILPLLEALKDDPSDYVRRSVANSLNDIAKDHPDLVADIAKRWMRGASPERARLVRHACRTLVKAGHGKTLSALGFSSAPSVALAGFVIETPKVRYGAHAAFVAELRNTAAAPQNIVLDYVIHHRKKSGGTSPKVFKWKTLVLKPRETVRLMRRHAIRPITTRVYYAGQHRIEVMINGRVAAGGDFDLVL